MQNTFKETAHRRGGKNILSYIFILVVLLIVIAALLLVPKITRIGKVEVPNFIGQEIKTATETAATKEITLLEQAKQNSDAVAVGVILSQSPKKGILLKKKDTVWVVVSKGRLTNVPRLTGFKKEDAASELQKSELTLGKIKTIPSETIPPGRIINTNPPPDFEIEKGKPVDLVISSGPKVVIPPPVPVSFARPAIQFQSLDVKDPDRRGFNLAVGFLVNNPNPVSGKVKGFYYKLEVEEHYLGSGTYYCNYSLNPNENTMLLINVNIRYDRIAKAAADLIGKGEVSYKVRGYYILEAEGGRSIEPAAITGRFNIAEKIGPFLKSIFPRESR